MDRNTPNRYRDSQDHLIITLNEQIEAMMPLKDSYSSIQRYHIKLTNELQTLIKEQNINRQAYQKQIREIALINEELDSRKLGFIEELRILQKELAKLNLQKKNLFAASETCTSKMNFQNQQSLALQHRSKELLEDCKKIEQSVAFNQKLVRDIENEIKLKQRENIQLKQQISRKLERKQKLEFNCQQSESMIKKVGNANEDSMALIKQLENSINTNDIKLRDEFKRGKQINEQYLQLKEKLSNLDHQREYYVRLIQSELLNKEDLDISQEKLQSILQRRIYDLKSIQDQNRSLETKIETQQSTRQRNIQQKDKLANHLAELIRTNTLLLDNMERCCGEDRKVNKILEDKFDKLDISWQNMKGLVNRGYPQQRGKRLLREVGNIYNVPKSPYQTQQSFGYHSKMENWHS